jgi:hypothetical protein
MPTRLDVLLQRRKSAAAGSFHRQVKASTKAGARAAVMGFTVRVRASESFRIIEAKLYQFMDGFA